MNKTLIRSYVKMIKHGICSVKQIPEKYQEAVNEEIINPSSVDEVVEENKNFENKINGALYIPEIKNCEVDTTILEYDHEYDIIFKTNDIFTPEIMSNNPPIQDIEYSIIRIENLCGTNGYDLDINLFNDEDGFTISLDGRIHEFTGNTNLLRIDIGVKSSNYEDMRFMIFFTAM